MTRMRISKSVIYILRILQITASASASAYTLLIVAGCDWASIGLNVANINKIEDSHFGS
jgi:hypothetical protein